MGSHRLTTDHSPLNTVLVTGANGFLGSQLCRALTAGGHQVRALHRRSSSLGALEGVPVERHIGDILDPASLAAPMRDVSLVFHAAAQSAYWRRPQDVVQAAVDGTRHVVRAARSAGVRRLVLTSSVAALGVPAPGELLHEGNRFNLPQGRFLYGYSKLRSEEVALEEAGAGLEIVIVNPSIVLGAGDINRISGSILIEAARGRPGERYLLGGENLTHRQALTEVARIVGRRPPWLRIPNGLIPLLAASLDLVGRVVATPLNGAQLRMSRYRLWVDTSKSHRELGLAAPKSFSLAAQEAYDWYRSEGLL